MPRSYCKLFNHVVFSTKNRQPLIRSESENKVHHYMWEQLKKLDCFPIAINGMPDHVHLLFMSNYKLSLMDIMQRVKGNTSFWINANKLSNEKFGWQDTFAAFSVGEDGLQVVRNYILNQKVHHAKRSFQQECEEFIRQYGAEESEDGLVNPPSNG